MKNNSKKIWRADFCVIGGGPAGLSFSANAVQAGASVILIEKEKMGGECLNFGCVPSKALIAAANVGHKIKESFLFGWQVEKAQVNFKKVHDHVHGVIQDVAPSDSVEKFEKMGVKIILEKAQFIDDTTVETNNYLIKAKRFIIATGSRPFIPPIEGLTSIKYYTNETIFNLEELPDHLVILGGGPIGIEMAQAFLRLGSRVTVLQRSTILPKNDPDMTLKLKEMLLKEGMDIQEKATVLSAKQKEETIEITYQNADNKALVVSASHLLIASGRTPNIDSLNLEAVQVNTFSKGITVDSSLRTSNPRILAIGDCTGGYQFTHAAAYQAGIAVENAIFNSHTPIHNHFIPWVTYTDPELAHVGFTETQLKQKKIRYTVVRASFQDNDRAYAERRVEGEIKILVSPKEHVLGASIIGIHAGELLYPWAMAIQNKLKVSAIKNVVAPFPTLSEINKRVATLYYQQKKARWKKGIVKLLLCLKK